MSTNMRAVENAMRFAYVEIVCDKRLKTNSSVFLFSYFNIFSYIRQIFIGLRIVWRNFNTIKNIANIFKVKPRLLTLNIFESIFVLNCIERFFRKHNDIKKIILNTDVHKVSRAITLYAQKEDIETFVLQHGATILEYGYLPVTANYMFAWGDLSKTWFVERGTEKEKIIVTGTPKTDFLIKYNKERNVPNKINKVLLIVNPIGISEVISFLNLIYDADIHLNYQLSIKLHPSSNDNRTEVEARFKLANVKIFKEENIHDLINQNDVVITTTSTVGNEAIALRKPLIKIEIDGINNILEYDLFDCSFSIKHSEELSNLLNDKKLLYSKRINYERFIEKYFYKLDGNATNRIIEKLVN